VNLRKDHSHDAAASQPLLEVAIIEDISSTGRWFEGYPIAL